MARFWTDLLHRAVQRFAVRRVLGTEVLEDRLDVAGLLVGEAEGLLGVLEMAEEHDAAELAGAAVRASVHPLG